MSVVSVLLGNPRSRRSTPCGVFVRNETYSGGPIVGGALLLLAAIHTPARAQEMHVVRGAGPFADPVRLASDRHEPGRVWVVELGGRIRSVVGDVVRPAPFLDIESEIEAAGESGLFALAFHPEYPVDRRCYVHFVERQTLRAVVREYVVADPPDAVVPGSGIDILALPSTSHGHRGGPLAFGPDGMLYVAMGNQGPTSNSQSLAVPWGKILRLDVDAPAPHVPADNPYTALDDGAHDLIWASGLRNPWSMSFDRGTGDLWIADVGDSRYEEVDVQRANAGPPGSPGYQGGRNYGYKCYEGTYCTGYPGCTCPMAGFIDPLFVELTAGLGAIIGGFVYRGSDLPALRGDYLYGGFSGRVWKRSYDGQVAGPAIALTTLLEPPGLDQLSGLVAIGEDWRGEICLLTLGPVSWLWRVVPGPQPCIGPDVVCTSRPNSFGWNAALYLEGTPCISADDVSVRVYQCIPGSTGQLVLGRPAPAVVFGNGSLCLGGPLVRRAPVALSANGSALIDADPSSLPIAQLPGQTWAYQFVYRDASAPPSFVNTTGASSFTFGP